ncbi:MAG: enoyl-CoA hydratase-related protein, partial [Planctomycetota bacterium]
DTFHGMFEAMHNASVPVLAAVRGQCLGGGLELAAFCHRVFASPDAMLGQPEIQLGVFAPVASVILPGRIGRGAAEDLCLTGRVLPAGEALQMGLVDEVTADPMAGALAWAEQHLLPRSAASLRCATQAARRGFMRRFREEIVDLTSVYLDELMTTADAKEGIAAFLEKRAPVWRNE